MSGILIEFDHGPDGAARGFRILEGAPNLTLLRVAAPASKAAEGPLFLRGSMNDWSTSIPLTASDDGALVAEAVLAAGDHQFKIASQDWRSADLGAGGTDPLVVGAEAHVLVPHGGNIRLTVPTPGRYRFELRTADGRSLLTVGRIADR